MKYAYIFDTKLVAYFLIQRHRSITDVFQKIASLLSFLEKRGDIYLCFDIGHSDYRLGEQSFYKGHRRTQLAKKSKAEQIAHAQFNETYTRLPEIFELLKVHTLAVKGVEADDLASLVCEDLMKDPDMKVTLVTGDYDWFHMVMSSPNTRLFDFPNGKMYYQPVVKKKYNLRTRREFSVLKSIIGDKSDNIKCINNLAEIKGRKFFDEMYEKYNDAPTDEQIVEHLIELVDSKPNFSVHKFHVADGRETPDAAYMSNMKIADPFTTLDNMTPEQQEEYHRVRGRGVGDGMSEGEFFNKCIEVFGFPIQINDKEKRIFGVR